MNRAEDHPSMDRTWRSFFGNIKPLRLVISIPFLLILIALISSYSGHYQICVARELATGQDLTAWINEEIPVAVSRMSANISPKKWPDGCVQASQGAVQASPNKAYYYHWVRDAGLVMKTVAQLYTSSPDPQEKAQYYGMMKDYVHFARKNQLTPNPSNERGIGEPKFNMDGSAFTESWGRPQDDGPAIRVISLVAFAQQLANSHSPEDRQLLGEIRDIIKDDLNYLVKYWNQTSYDLWEEVKGHHFHTRMVQRRAFMEGPKVLPSSDSLVMDCDQARKAIEPQIRGHWRPEKRILVVTSDCDKCLDYKTSGLDTGVVLGVLQADIGDGFFSPTDDQVLSTVELIQQRFRQIYPSNQNAPIAGVDIGRYPEDRYAGSGNVCPAEGNPWVLGTLAFAELYYRTAAELQNKKELEINSINIPFYRSVLEGTPFQSKVVEGTKLSAQDDMFAAVISSLVKKGDDFVARVKYHANPDGSLNEQCNRDNGFMCSVEDLTWNYAAFLETAWARSRVMAPKLAQTIQWWRHPAAIGLLNLAQPGGRHSPFSERWWWLVRMDGKVQAPITMRALYFRTEMERNRRKYFDMN
jgi:glucoamylase